MTRCICKELTPFLLVSIKMDDTEPLAERFIRVLKNGASNMREAVAGIWP